MDIETRIKRLQFISDYMNDEVSSVIKYIKQDAHIDKLDLIEIKAYPDDSTTRDDLFYIEYTGSKFINGNKKSYEPISYLISTEFLKENGFTDLNDFLQVLEYEVNKKFGNYFTVNIN